MRKHKTWILAAGLVFMMLLTACGTKQSDEAVNVESTAVPTETNNKEEQPSETVNDIEETPTAELEKEVESEREEPEVEPESVPEWDAESVYVGGDRVMCEGVLYEADWWTQGENPAKQTDEWGVWKPVTEVADKEDTDITATEPETSEEAVSQPETSQKPSSSEKPDVAESTKPPERENDKPAQTALAAHVITGYWQNFNNGAKCLKISDVPEGYNLIAVAFAEATSTPGKVTFKLDEGLSQKLNGYTKKQFIEDIAEAKKKGQRVIISVGGEVGNVSVTNEEEAKQFADSVYKLMLEYGFDGVDIDLEHGISAKYMEKALRRLFKKAGEGLIITMAPQTLDMQNTETEYFKLALKIKDILTIVNMQYYNSGSMLGQDGKVYSQGGVDFLTALADIQLQNGLLPEQVGIGVPASEKGAGSGYVDPSIVNKAVNCLAKGEKGGKYKPEKKYPGLRGVMTWSINWDASNDYKFLKKVEPVMEKLP